MIPIERIAINAVCNDAVQYQNPRNSLAIHGFFSHSDFGVPSSKNFIETVLGLKAYDYFKS
jgi:hypothetical protein